MFNQKNKIAYIVVPTLTEEQAKLYKDVSSLSLKNTNNCLGKYYSGDEDSNESSMVPEKLNSDIMTNYENYENDETEISIGCDYDWYERDKDTSEADENEVNEAIYGKYNNCNIDDTREN